MVTQEYIDGLPSLKNLILLLKDLPSVIRAEVKPVEDSELAEISHQSAVQISVFVDRKVVVETNPNIVPIIVDAEKYLQEISFSMPPIVYTDEAKNDAIVRAMKEKINEYYATGEVKKIQT